MKVEINRAGNLIVAPESRVEEYALKQWAEANEDEIPSTMMVLADRTIPIDQAEQAFAEQDGFE